MITLARDTFSLQSPTLDEFVVYKLLQALSGEKYYNKCIRIPSTGNFDTYRQHVINVMNHQNDDADAIILCVPNL